MIQKIPRLIGNVTPSFCLDDCLATYAGYVGTNYEFAYLDAMRIAFRKEESRQKGIGRSIDYNIKTEENLNQYVGIRREKLNQNYEEALHTIQNETKEGTVFQIGICGYSCPWDWRYGEINEGVHSMFAVSWDENEQKIHCVDPYYEKQSVDLDYEDFKKGFQTITRITYNESEEFNLECVLKEKLNELIKNGHVQSLNEMADSLEKEFSLKLEIRDYDENEFLDMEEIQHRIYLNDAMQEIAHNRVRFAVLLNKMEKHNSAYADLTKDALNLAEKWNSVRMMLIKKVFARKTSNLSEYLAKKVKAVAEEEEIFIQKTIQMLSGKTVDFEKNHIEKNMVVGNKVEFIPLENYFNNEGIGCYGSDTADLNNSGEYFISDQFKSANEIKCKEMPFYLLDKQEGKADNIACSKQRIPVKTGKYTTLAILGCSEWGNYKDDFTICYSDGATENVSVKFPDWVPELEFGEPENIAFKAEKAEVLINGKLIGTEECNMYMECASVNGDKEIDSIILPECINMHVFAMTMIGKD